MEARIDHISTTVFTIPTDRPEADGTLDWNESTIVIVFVGAGGKTGLGYSYAAQSDALMIQNQFSGLLAGMDALNVPACHEAMRAAVRNLGLRGQVASAIAAVDTALWDLKAKLFNVSLATLLGGRRQSVPVYGSGGFTNYDASQIADQIEGWRSQGIKAAKIKVGSKPEDDPARVKLARQALGRDGALFVDANGAYSTKQALACAEKFREEGVSWFEEPVSSDHLDGLRLIRENGPAGMDIAAGEYGYDLFYFRRMLDEGAVDVLQLDATRCAGYTGFMQAAALAMAKGISVSAHCAPALHLPVCAHVPHLQHLEYFYDHVRIEHMLFDGLPPVIDGCLTPDRSKPGHGLELKDVDAQRYAA